MLAARVDMELVINEVAPEPLITLKPQGGVIMKLKKVN